MLCRTVQEHAAQVDSALLAQATYRRTGARGDLLTVETDERVPTPAKRSGTARLSRRGGCEVALCSGHRADWQKEWELLMVVTEGPWCLVAEPPARSTAPAATVMHGART